EVVDGVKVYRVPQLRLFKKTTRVKRSPVGQLLLKLQSALGYFVEYFYFTTAALIVSTYVFVRHGFDVIHAHNPPDTLFLVAVPCKLLGKKFVFDQHDVCPELYRSRYGAPEGFYTKLLKVLEWC